MSGPATARDIAERLNLTKHPRSWRGRCPACDYPGNTFSLREKRGRTSTYCANGCGHDQIDDALSRVIADFAPRPQTDDAASDAERRAKKQAAALRLWNGSAETGHEAYLCARGLGDLIGSTALRFRPDCTHPEGGRYPAMVALVQDVNGAHVAAHRTYLRPDRAGKAAIEPPKASLGPVWGGAIRLHPPAAELVVGEGIETSASAGVLIGLPAWAALSAGNLALGLKLPPEVRSVTIAADADSAGFQAAQSAASRWRAEGRRVRIATPDAGGRDFNDIIMEKACG
ncbi:MAG: hypothetical protein ABS99_05710 [Acetobacteraceae bacterium SCN 69-10]|nr:toprim domain-containing protein [Rhodospirillales bacterium]ODU56591.1 MAG: hypothetical protein ABS99_05710 [Acetobacteraceae bacterium SCN 69-10]OJY67264.1 MAG: hypothetical protein BGP12_14045 [Rhodospirillales bacterium 70-18]